MKKEEYRKHSIADSTWTASVSSHSLIRHKQHWCEAL